MFLNYNVNSFIPDDIVSLDIMDLLFFFNLCINCITLVDSEIVERIQFVMTDYDLTHSNCILLVEEFIVYYYSIQFLYRN